MVIRLSALKSPSLVIAGSGAGAATPLLAASFLAAREPGAPRLFSLVLAAHLVGVFSADFIAPRLPEFSPSAILALVLSLATLCGASTAALKLWAPPLAWILPFIVMNGFLSAALSSLISRYEGRAGTLYFWSHLSPLLFSLPLVYGLVSRFGHLSGALALGLVATAIAAVVLLAERPFRVVPLCAFAIAACVPPWLTITARRDSPSRLLLTEARGENRDFPGIPQHSLYLDGRLVFSSNDEQGDHLCLVGVGTAAAGEVKSALVIGGGDGLTARNLLSSPRTQAVQIVERVAALAQLGKTDLKVRMYNLDSLKSPKVRIVVIDPLAWMRAEVGRERFDLVVLDEPPSFQLRALTTKTFEAMRLVRRLLRPGGAVTLRVGPALDATRKSLTQSLATARRTLEEAGFSTLAYSNHRGDMGYVLGVAGPAPNPASLFRRSALSHFCTLDPQWRIPPAKPHRLIDPRLAEALGGDLPRPLFLPD